jgi:hypothetical protein
MWITQHFPKFYNYVLNNINFLQEMEQSMQQNEWVAIKF